MEKIKISCLGNSFEDTVTKSQKVTVQYNIKLNGLLTPDVFIGDVNSNLENVTLQHWRDLYE